MNYRVCGATDLKFSELGFGCGSVGGLIIRGKHRDSVRAVARAIELGINYFDTAAIYGRRQSETNLGKVLAELRAPVLVGTKVQLAPADLEDIERAVFSSLETSLRLLQREQVDILYLHNYLGARRDAARNWVTPADAAAAIEAFRKLQAQGKIRYWALNALGDAQAVHEAVGSFELHAIQTCYNLLNPSAGSAVPAGFPFQDLQNLIGLAAERRVGVVAIRVLAAGALSGTAEKHPLADPSLSPIATGHDYEQDVQRAALFRFLVDEGYAGSLVEAAIRFVISHPQVTTTLVGFSSLEQLEEAAQSVNRGPLPAEALDRIQRSQETGL